jgi:di/tricarboxylate transporter
MVHMSSIALLLMFTAGLLALGSAATSIGIKPVSAAYSPSVVVIPEFLSVGIPIVALLPIVLSRRDARKKATAK